MVSSFYPPLTLRMNIVPNVQIKNVKVKDKRDEIKYSPDLFRMDFRLARLDLPPRK